MKITKEMFDKFVEPSEEIVSLLKEKCKNVDGDDRDYVDRGDLDFELNGFGYSLCEFSSDSIQDEGKYQHGGTTYQLVEFDKFIESYPNKKSTTKEFNLFVYVGFSRSGSYYSDWYYMYDEPTVSKVEMKHVERKVIEAHDVFTFVAEKVDTDMTIEECEDSWDDEEDEE
jgi:hypothetical protein